MTAAEADVEPYDEAMIYFKIWEFENRRHEKEQKMAEWRAQNQH